ncbi:MAG: hypothetical protein JST79_12405 [Acidobacteria bacterium]|jgi:hypothetical protein|nr:hypothetical protein [Acidobacteriota bacterium]
MTITKFVVKVSRAGASVPAYVLRMNGGPIQMTSQRKLALVMGKFDAEAAVESLRKRGSQPELVTVPVRVRA